MIDFNNQDEIMWMECDGTKCGEYLELFGSWNDCIQEAKDEGWRIFNNAGDWEHYCPHCWNINRAQTAFGGQ